MMRFFLLHILWCTVFVNSSRAQVKDSVASRWSDGVERISHLKIIKELEQQSFKDDTSRHLVYMYIKVKPRYYILDAGYSEWLYFKKLATFKVAGRKETKIYLYDTMDKKFNRITE